MEFTGVPFLVCMPLFAVLYRFAPAQSRALLLTFASYGFYAATNAKMALLLAAATLAAFFAARVIGLTPQKTIKRTILLAFVLVMAGMLIAFKSSVLLRPLLGFDLLMPLGISYYTFKAIGYVLDVYWGNIFAENDFFALAAYLAFFSQIVAGPIERAQSFLPQLQNRRASLSQMMLGLQRVALGVFKKFVVADSLAVLVNFIYSHVHAAGTPLAAGFYAYPLQLYADFSGLSDIAIGAALLLGMVSPENFHAPFAASNPTEFWRRWHITLTTWLTDYVFTPLRMATRDWGNAGLVLSLSINMTLIGAWHGFRWGYVLFGLVHALYLSVDALTQRARKRYYKAHPGMNRLTDWLGPVVVFHLAAAAFVVFRAQTTHDAFYVLTHPANGLAAPSLEFLKMSQANVVALIAGLVGYALIEAADWARRRNQQNSPAVAWPRWGRWSLYSCTVVTVAVMILLLMGGHASQNPFIYEIF